MLRLVVLLTLLPMLAVAGLVAAIGTYARNTVPPEKVIARAYAGEIEAQKHLAGCYESGACLRLLRSAVLGCAWRQVIVDKTREADAAIAAQRACGGLDQSHVDMVAGEKSGLKRQLQLAEQHPF